MSLFDREEQLLNLLSHGDEMSVEELAKAMFVSEPTIRRDLATLTQKGLILRTHGGAILNRDASSSLTPLDLRKHHNSAEKKLIANTAVSLVKNGDVIMMDASTTTSYLIPLLTNFSNIIVITSGVYNTMLLSNTNIKTLCTGGILINHSYSYVGQDAVDMVRHYNADLYFFSCHGIIDGGMLTDPGKEENDLRREMMKRSRKTVLMLDSGKFDVNGWNNLCSLGEVDYCICDCEIPERFGKPRFPLNSGQKVTPPPQMNDSSRTRGIGRISRF